MNGAWVLMSLFFSCWGINISLPFLVVKWLLQGIENIPDPTPCEAWGMFITVPIKAARFMVLLFNSFNSLFIARLMLLIYFLLKQIKTICADTGLDF